MVNTERELLPTSLPLHYNILNIVVNTELIMRKLLDLMNYNILNIVVNTEPTST